MATLRYSTDRTYLCTAVVICTTVPLVLLVTMTEAVSPVLACQNDVMRAMQSTASTGVQVLFHNIAQPDDFIRDDL